MPYRASIGGAFGGGAGPATAHPIDYGAIIDSAVGGASTLIGNIYARKRAEAELGLAKQKADQEAQRYADQNTRETQRYNDQDKRERDRYAAQQRLERLKLRISAAGTGVTLGPEFDEPGDTPGATPAPPANLPPIASAMTQPPSAGNVDFRTPPVTPAYTDQGAPEQGVPSVAQAYQASAPAPVPPRPATGYHPENDPRIKRAVEQANAVEQVKLKNAPLMASADSAKAVNTARGLIPVHVAQLQAEAPIKTAQELDLARQKQKLMLDAPPQIRAEATRFDKENKQLTDAVTSYAAAKNAFAEARSGNPAALKSAILSFAAVADPKAQLRQGVIHMIEQVDPSVKGNFDLAVAKLTSGTLPPRILDDMEKMVDRTHVTHKALFEQHRAAVVGRHPALDGYLPSSKELFDVPGVSAGTSHAPTANGVHPVAQKYGITPTTP